ncbi:hypothetical protein LguiA_026504 [Lonicera macranthoides]
MFRAPQTYGQGFMPKTSRTSELRATTSSRKHEEEDHEKIVKVEERETNNGGLIVPRRFMDLSLAGIAEPEEPSLSSLEGRGGDRSRSPGLGIE